MTDSFLEQCREQVTQHFIATRQILAFAIFRIVFTDARERKITTMPTLPNDSSTTIADLKNRILAFARERDWEQFHAPKNLSMALAAEAGELMEHFLWASPLESAAIVRSDLARRKKIEEELADVIIYALEFANVTGIDVASAITSKMKANAEKYPVEKARGRSDKYTEL